MVSPKASRIQDNPKVTRRNPQKESPRIYQARDRKLAPK